MDFIDSECVVIVGGRNFVLSGKFESGSKSEIEKFIKDAGGNIEKRVTLSTDYVVVGNIPSPEWKHGKYGTKVAKAKMMQEDGKNICVISEKMLLDALADGKGDVTDCQEVLLELFIKNVEEIDFREVLDWDTQEVSYVSLKDLATGSNIEEILKRFKSRVKHIEKYLKEAKYFYNRLSNKEKEEIRPVLKEKLYHFKEKTKSFGVETKDIANAFGTKESNCI